MRASSIFVAATTLSVAIAQETVLGIYIFSRHGDRTAKSTPPTQLTDLGYDEVFERGTYYRNRYVSSNAARMVYGISNDLVRQSQVVASAPTDNVLQNSAMAFLQGIYPPVGSLAQQTLRNGSIIQSPLNGYQLIPLQTVATGANSEDVAWLQGSTNCANAQISSNNFLSSSEFLETLESTRALYESVYPMVNGTFTSSQVNFKNAYVVWDLLNVASIHNQSVTLPNSDTMAQLAYLADQHELGLAFNSSEPIRAVTGSIIAAEVLEALNTTITTKGKSNLNVQFGAYAGMLSFFGLSELLAQDPAFRGIPDYASTLVWEIVTNATVASDAWPGSDELAVRFYFHNGTSSASPEPVEYPLFQSDSSPMPWDQFAAHMTSIAILGQDAWCEACGNTTGVCSDAYLTGTSGSSGTGATQGDSQQGGMSRTVAGVVGAMATLAVILLIQGIVILAGGYRLVSKRTLLSSSSRASDVINVEKA